jgi:hypothetical protein
MKKFLIGFGLIFGVLLFNWVLIGKSLVEHGRKDK